MLIYLLTGLISYLSLRNYEKVDTGSGKCDYYWKIFYKYFTIVFLALVFGLRDYSVGTDTKNYLDIFNWLGSDFIWERFIYEKGFCILSVLVNKLFGNFTIFLIICGFIIYFNVIHVFCKMSQSPSISILCYFGIGSFAQSCNALRQYLAISFCLLALYYLIKKDNDILFAFHVIVAFLFHKSAIVFIIILPLKYFRFNIRSFYVLILIGVVAIPVIPYVVRCFDMIFHTSYYGYLKLFGFVSPINIIVVIFSIICLFIVFLCRLLVKQKFEETKSYNIYIMIFTIFIYLMLVSVLISELIDRIAIYFLSIIYFIIPSSLCVFKKYKINIITKMMLIIFACFLVCFLSIRGTYGIIPYTFV